jgi:hypothetical protein
MRGGGKNSCSSTRECGDEKEEQEPGKEEKKRRRRRVPIQLVVCGVFAVVVVTRRVEVRNSNGFSGGGGVSHSWLPCYCRCARFVGVFIFFSLYSSSRAF